MAMSILPPPMRDTSFTEPRMPEILGHLRQRNPDGTPNLLVTWIAGLEALGTGPGPLYTPENLPIILTQVMAGAPAAALVIGRRGDRLSRCLRPMSSLWIRLRFRARPPPWLRPAHRAPPPRGGRQRDRLQPRAPGVDRRFLVGGPLGRMKGRLPREAYGAAVLNRRAHATRAFKRSPRNFRPSGSTKFPWASNFWGAYDTKTSGRLRGCMFRKTMV